MVKTPLLALGPIVFLVWGIWQLTPNDETLIRKHLTRLAATVSFPRHESALARLANINKLRDFFSPDAVLNLELEHHGPQRIEGRDGVVQTAATARQTLGQAQLRLHDITVSLGDGAQTANARMTLLGDIGGEKYVVAQELNVSLKKVERIWLINGIETVRTLQ